MAVDFMVHRAPLLNKIIILLFASFLGCTSKKQENNVQPVFASVNISDAAISMGNGLLLQNNKPFNGTIFTLYAGTKDTAALTSYLKGQEHGEWKKLYPSQRIKEKRHFTNGKKTGEYLAWWENGNKQLHYIFENDEYEGTCKEWNEKGMLNKVMNYKKGHEEGQQQWWYDNGKIKANYVIKDGRRFGLLGTKNCINVSDSIFKN